MCKDLIRSEMLLGCIERLDLHLESVKPVQELKWFKYLLGAEWDAPPPGTEYDKQCDIKTAFMDKFFETGQKLKRMPYAQYLRTDHWAYMRLQVQIRDQCKCKLCSSIEKTEVHHNTYDRRGFEDMDDLILLCHECHSRHHGIKSDKDAKEQAYFRVLDGIDIYADKPWKCRFFLRLLIDEDINAANHLIHLKLKDKLLTIFWVNKPSNKTRELCSSIAPACGIELVHTSYEEDEEEIKRQNEPPKAQMVSTDLSEDDDIFSNPDLSNVA